MNTVQRVVAFLIRVLTGTRLVADPPPAQAVYYANHSSHLDFISFWASLPQARRVRCRAVAAADYWGRGGIVKLINRVFRLYLVDRGQGGDTSPTPAPAGGPVPVTTLRGQTVGMGAVLTAGDSLLIFPEGTRGNGDELAEFQPGLARLAEAFPGVPVIPVALGHLHRMLPKGKVLPVPLYAEVTFLDPVEFQPGESHAEFSERARRVLAEALRGDGDLSDDAEKVG